MSLPPCLALWCSRLRKVHVDTPMALVISVYWGHLEAGGFGDLQPLASVVAERWYMAPGVKRLDVAERGVVGTLFIPAGRPVCIYRTLYIHHRGVASKIVQVN